MKPSTLTPTGAPNGRGFLVQTEDGRKGRTYHRESYIRDRVKVYIETSPGEYADTAIMFPRTQISVIGYIE